MRRDVGMIVRPLEPRDIDAVADRMIALVEHIRHETADPYFEWDALEPSPLRAALLAVLDQPSRRVFVAERKGTVVGFLEAAVVPCFLPFSRTVSVGRIFAAWVDPPHRRGGVIDALEEAASAFFRAQGVGWVELHALSANALALRTWRRLGFRTFREQMRKVL
jgi:ribosomal protein S18 acetylase RimI-like enzyme